MKVGLVLEGGGMRGLYTAGVLDAFLEAGIKVDGVVSVSAGALFGVNYLSTNPKELFAITSDSWETVVT